MNRLTKRIIILLILIFIVTFSLAGCKTKENLEDKEDKKENTPETLLEIVDRDAKAKNKENSNSISDDFSWNDFSIVINNQKISFPISVNEFQQKTNYMFVNSGNISYDDIGYLETLTMYLNYNLLDSTEEPTENAAIKATVLNPDTNRRHIKDCYIIGLYITSNDVPCILPGQLKPKDEISKEKIERIFGKVDYSQNGNYEYYKINNPNNDINYIEITAFKGKLNDIKFSNINFNLENYKDINKKDDFYINEGYSKIIDIANENSKLQETQLPETWNWNNKVFMIENAYIKLPISYKDFNNKTGIEFVIDKSIEKGAQKKVYYNTYSKPCKMYKVNGESLRGLDIKLINPAGNKLNNTGDYIDEYQMAKDCYVYSIDCYNSVAIANDFNRTKVNIDSVDFKLPGNIKYKDQVSYEMLREVFGECSYTQKDIDNSIRYVWINPNNSAEWLSINISEDSKINRFYIQSGLIL